jgi:hypothetical protein
MDKDTVCIFCFTAIVIAIIVAAAIADWRGNGKGGDQS